MGSVRLKIVHRDFRKFRGTRIQQSEVSAGPDKQYTVLKSCVCVGFHHATKRLGAISHITGFSFEGGHSARGALRTIQRKLARFDVDLRECDCFVIGGTERARHVYDQVMAELRAREIAYQELDVLGGVHRKILYDPATGIVALYRKSDDGMWADARKIFSSDRPHTDFQDQRHRLIVGPSLFFRNESMLKHIEKDVLPTILKRRKRLHVWCAGCSIGMEVYSVAMIGLEWLSRHWKTNVDFRILGTDISSEALEVASKGEYWVNERAMQSHPQLFRKYAERIDTHNVRVGRRLKEVVYFKQSDIGAGSRRHRFDLVICDHVLQYFSPETQLEMLHSLATAVYPSAFLYASSPSSTIPEELTAKLGFTCLARSFYRKG